MISEVFGECSLPEKDAIWWGQPNKRSFAPVEPSDKMLSSGEPLQTL